MRYDTIIAGAGPAGLSCGIRLAKAGQKVLILEKRTALAGKVCGDGLSSSCVKSLEKLNITPEALIAAGGIPVRYHVSFVYGRLERSRYKASETQADFAIGMSRDIFDGFLLERAKEAGCEIRMGETVCGFSGAEGEYHVFARPVTAGTIGQDTVSYESLHYICASGAAGALALQDRNEASVCHRPAILRAGSLSGLPAGMSARIRGQCSLRPDAFYFKFAWPYGKGYAWIFPAGPDLWNYGVYNPDRRQDLRKLFAELDAHVKKEYFSSWAYDRRPGGALVGSAPAFSGSMPGTGCAGDCLGAAEPESGEGISYAIETGIRLADAILAGRPAPQDRLPVFSDVFAETEAISPKELQLKT